MHPQPQGRPSQPAAFVPSAQAPRGAVAALQRPLAAAEAAALAGDWQTVHRELAGPQRAYGASLGNGRLFELWGLCGAEGVGAIDAVRALTQALHAYQEEHYVAGMARCHFELGEANLGRGELAQAEREYGYAHSLFARHGSVQERVLSRSRQAFVALQRGHTDAGLEHADAALQLGRELAAPACVEAGARLVRAQAFAAMGHAQAGARDLLWAERLLGSAADSDAHVATELLLTRAESLLGLGYPRRALTVLLALQPSAQAGAIGSRIQAQALRLEGESALGDNPQRSYTLLAQAQRRFVALKQPYFRVACEIALARAAHRCSDPSLRGRLDALGSSRLARWPRLAAAFDQLSHELQRPDVPVPGAVRAPWVQALGHYRGQVDVHHELGAPNQAAEAEPPDDAEAQAGLLSRLQTVWGRWLTPRAQSR